MEFKINGKEKELRFGIGFIRKLDEKFRVSHEGLEFGMGLVGATMQLRMKNPTVLSDIIQAATVGGATERQVDVAVEDYADVNDGLFELFGEIEEEMGKSKVVKDSIQNLEDIEENL